ncbi:MAG: hypothetical protein ACI9XR_001662 [Flavobacterium sp.]
MTALEKENFMIKRVSFYIAIALVVFFISSAFKPLHSEKITWLADDYETENLYQYPSEQPSDYVAQFLPFIGKRFVGFKEALAFKESQGKYNKVNSLGYLGKYQFGTSTLRSVGISDSMRFLKNPKLQEKAFVALLKKNKYILRNIIKKYRGKVIDGVKITESGILAAAHLGGAGSVKVFLQSNGKRKVKDKYGTSIKSYLRDFGGYETHNIIADLNAKAH